MSIPAIILLITIVATYVSLGPLFKKAGRAVWEAYLPIYNLFIWQKITDRPWYWVLILCIPGVQFVMLMIMHVNLVWSFGHRGTTNTLLATFLPFYIIPKIAFDKQSEYTGNLIWKVPGERNKKREWADALLFALIAAYIVRTFIFESFTIPTGSMEKSMQIGDYLFVSKARYGAKVPETPISFPLAHHTMPVLGTKSYLDWQKLDYMRLPGWADIERNDPIVFNYPLGDTVIIENEVMSWYQFVRSVGLQMAKQNPAEFEADRARFEQQARTTLERDPRFTLSVRPKDKKENYVKRCVGMPGDEIEIIDGRLMIDGAAAQEIPGLQYDYTVMTKQPITNAWKEQMKEEIDLDLGNTDGVGKRYSMLLTDAQVALVKDMNLIDTLYVDWQQRQKPSKNAYSVFPWHEDFNWTIDNFGPLRIPADGMTIELTDENMALYRRCIEVYEENEVSVVDGKVYINGEIAESYTFTLNYFWMMGDNRHRSQDSRIFGLVPEDHVVGRPSFVWLSLDEERSLFEGKVRFGRMFRGVE